MKKLVPSKAWLVLTCRVYLVASAELPHAKWMDVQGEVTVGVGGGVGEAVTPQPAIRL